MAKSDSLFMLIKAMTKAEKRYFKVENKRDNGQGKDYLRLFDAIEEQKDYDEGLIKESFKGEPYFNQLSAVKFYLYRQIIKSLNNFYQESSINIQLNNYLIEIEVLYKKGLLKNCAASIKKAKALTIKYEAWLDMLKLLVWELKVINRLYKPADAEELRKKLAVEKEDTLKKYISLSDLYELTNKISLFFKQKGYAKTAQDRAYIEELLTHELLHKSYSVEAEISRLAAVANCYMILGKREERFTMSKKGLEFFRQYPHQVEEYMLVYFYNVRELADLAISLKKYAYAEELYKTMEEIYRNNPHKLDLKAKILHFDLHISLLLCKGDFKEALELLPQLLAFFETYGAVMDPLYALYIHNICFHVYFRNKDFRNTEYHLQKMINPGSEIRWDMQSLGRMANLIVQYEQREYEHLGYVLRSTYRYLLKKQMLERAETIILNFIRKATRLTTEKEVLQALRGLKEEFLPYKDESFISTFPLIEWIDSKLLNKPMSEIVREDYLKALQEEQRD